MAKGNVSVREEHGSYPVLAAATDIHAPCWNVISVRLHTNTCSIGCAYMPQFRPYLLHGSEDPMEWLNQRTSFIGIGLREPSSGSLRDSLTEALHED